MEGGAIVESQISASSVHYGILGLQHWGPNLARLNNQGIVNAWTSASHDSNPWIEVRKSGDLKVASWTTSAANCSYWLWSWIQQINMQKKMRLTGVITQGASRMGTAEYIKAFKVASSLDGNTYAIHKVQGQWRDKVKEAAAFGNNKWNINLYFDLSAHFVSMSQVFIGNTDNDSTKTNLFDPSIVAQYIRIIPVVCRRACTLRMELVGCELNGKQNVGRPWHFIVQLYDKQSVFCSILIA